MAHVDVFSKNFASGSLSTNNCSVFDGEHGQLASTQSHGGAEELMTRATGTGHDWSAHRAASVECVSGLSWTHRLRGSPPAHVDAQLRGSVSKIGEAAGSESIRIDIQPRPVLYRFFRATAFFFSCSTTSLARNFAMRSISFTGTGSESGNRIVPLLLTSYGASCFLNAATSRSLAG